MIGVLLCSLCGCGNEAEASTEPAVTEEEETDSSVRYEVPEFAVSVFDKEAADHKNGTYIDLSNSNKGYVAVSAVSDSRLKFQVITDVTYNYDLSSDGEVSFFPLQSGNGEYLFRVMENITENRYAILFDITRDTVIDDEFQPFIRRAKRERSRSRRRCYPASTTTLYAKDFSSERQLIGAVFQLGNMLTDNV